MVFRCFHSAVFLFFDYLVSFLSFFIVFFLTARWMTSVSYCGEFIFYFFWHNGPFFPLLRRGFFGTKWINCPNQHKILYITCFLWENISTRRFRDERTRFTGLCHMKKGRRGGGNVKDDRKEENRAKCRPCIDGYSKLDGWHWISLDS